MAQDLRLQNVFPFILTRISEIKPDTFLDYACGDASFSAMARPHVKGAIFAYDLYSAVRDGARKTLANVQGASVIEATSALPDRAINLIVLNAAWMCFEDAEQCNEILAEMHRLLKPGGRLIASVTHPAFRHHQFASHETDFDVTNYFSSGHPFTVYVGGKDAPSGTWNDFHWTVADHINQLIAAGLQIARMDELPDVERGGKRATGSQWIVIEAVKP